MDYFSPVKDESNNPKNRFLFCCCHSYEVDVGWGCGCCGCRAFPFSLGVRLFSAIYLIFAIKDIYDLIISNYLKEDNDNKLLHIFFIIKLISDIFILLGIICSNSSLRRKRYKLAVVGYYLVVIAFLLNTSFCIYFITNITSTKFWVKYILFKVLTIILWYVADYYLILFAWILFCNMVDIDRKIKEEQKNNPYNFTF